MHFKIKGGGCMIATDQIALQKQWDRDALDAIAAEEAERWEWYAEHNCTKTDVVITVVDNSTFTEACCPACYHEIWKQEGATLLHQLHLPLQVAA